MSDEIKMQIEMYCQAVATGNKPVAMLSIQSRYSNEIKKMVEREGLKIHLVDVNRNNSWNTAFIYRHDYLLEVIKKAPERPNSIYEHWVLGKLFGYSDEAIKDFLATLYDM